MKTPSLTAEQMAEVLERLLESGFEPPFYCACVSMNGGVIFWRYFWSESHEGLDAQIICQSTGECLVVPLNIMFVDNNGKAARVEIVGPKKMEFSIN